MSLLNLDPERLAAALPSLSHRRRSGSWPVGLLPIPEIADDLASFGYRYKRGSGFTSLGVTAASGVDNYDVARKAALILNMAADSLPSATPLGEQWFALAEELEAEVDRLHVETHDILDDYELAEAVYEPLAFMPTRVAAHFRALTESPEGARLAREHDAYGARFEEHADALRSTARDLKASPAAQSTFLKALRAVFPAPEAPAEDETAVDDFLASLDNLTTLPRPELLTRYIESGSPSNLSGTELRARAAARWGAPRKVQGTYTYRPAKATA